MIADENTADQFSWEEREGVFIVRGSALVHAPIDRCFQLTTSIALVQEELGMHPVNGRASGFVVANDAVRWEGWQLGMKHFHVTRITGYDRPVYMQDSMAAGRFRSFQHDHHLTETATGTLLRDEVRFTLPMEFIGRAIARHIMAPHVLRLLRSRFARIRRIAQGEDWRRYLAETEVHASASDTAAG